MNNYFGFPLSRLFQEIDVFEDGYGTGQILFREPQLKELRESLKPVFTNVTPGNIILYGMPATGKNCSAYRILNEVFEATDNAILVQIDCSEMNMPDDIVCGIIDELLEEQDQLDEIAMEDPLSYLKELIASKGKIILLYLNDINHLMIYGNLSDTLLLLSSVNKSFSTPRISIIATVVDTPRHIGTNLDLGDLDDLSPMEIYFPVYSKDEITAILTDHAERGLKPGVLSKELIDTVAGIASVSADVRYGIDLIYGATICAGKRSSNCIEERDIRMYLETANGLHHDRLISHLTSVEWEIYYRIINLEDTIIKFFSGRAYNRFDPDKPKQSLLKMILSPDPDRNGMKEADISILDLMLAVERFLDLGLFDARYL